MIDAILALDVGTTAAKCVAIAMSGEVLASADREYPLHSAEAGQRTQDPEQVWAAVLDVLRAVAAQGVTPQALALSAAVHALAGVDVDGTMRTPLITWADSRSEGQARALTGTDLGNALHDETGTPIHPMSPLTKLRWFAEMQPEFTPRWWWGIKEFIIWRLTGTVATEVSSASASGLMATRTGAWSALALEVAGISATQLAPIHACEDALPLTASIAAEMGLPAGLPVVLGGGDGPLANLGSGAFLPNRIGISLGTSAAVRRVTHTPGIGDARSRFCYALGHDTWVVGRAQSNGSSALRWAARTFAPDLCGPDGAVDDLAVLDRIATVPDGSGGVTFRPFLLPERTPRWELGLDARIEHLRPEHTSAHLLRATREGVVEALVEMARDIASDVSDPTFYATGGAFRGNLWQSLVVQRLGQPVQFQRDVQGTARGAAMIAAISLGIAQDLPAAGALLAAPAADLVTLYPVR